MKPDPVEHALALRHASLPRGNGGRSDLWLVIGRWMQEGFHGVLHKEEN